MRTARIKNTLLPALGIGLAACGVSMLILFAVYVIRGVWPFGTDNVAYADTAQFYLPGYYKIWDAFHGAPLNVNWTAGLAESGNAAISEFFWLPNIVFLLVPRDHVLEGLSLYLAVSLCMAAFTSGAVMRLRFPKLGAVWQLVFAVSYTLGGYSLQYYSNLFWLFIAAVFPVLLYALERLLRSGKYILYTLVFAFLVYESAYFTYMLTAYILLFSLAYALFILPKELRGDRLFRLGACTAAAFGISAGSFLSSASSMAGTSRFQENLDSGLIAGLTTWDITATRHTLAMLLGTALAIAVLLRALRRRRRLSGEARERADGTLRFFALLLGLLAVPMVFTNIDTAWHFGQYNFFPMRYGFVISGTLLAAAAVSLRREETAPERAAIEPDRRRRYLRAAGLLLIAAALVFLEPRLARYFREYGTVFLTAMSAREYWLSYLPLFLVCGALFTALYFLLLGLKNRRLSVWLIAAAAVLQLLANASGLIAPDDGHVASREYDPAYVEVSDSLHAYFAEAGLTPLTRAKNVDCSLSAGYPALAGVSAVSSVMSSNSALRLGVYRELGYTVEYFRILDTGGTALSDMMLGVDVILSARELDPSLYDDTGVTVDGIRIGTPRYAGAVGLTYDEDALNDYLDELTLDGRLNLLYRAFTGTDKTAAYVPRAALSAEGEGLVRYTLTLTPEEQSLLYLSADELMMSITVNGERYYVPSYQNLDYTSYPAAFNSNLLYLGTFGAEPVTVSFTSVEGLSMDMLHPVALSAVALDAFHADTGVDDTIVEGDMDGDRVTITLSGVSAGKRLFLPLTYSYRWQAEVNGRAVSVSPTLGVLCSVALDEGENTVTLTRGPARSGFGLGKLISCVSILCFAAWLIVRRRVKLSVPRGAGLAAQILFAAAVFALIAFLYITPVVLFIKQGTIVTF